MSTPTSDGGTAESAHAIVPGPIATNDQHVCFICLQNDSDTPNATWVNPCPCSLEAHEECMLRWIAETETSPDRPKSGLRCPACKGAITVDEPYDAFIALRDRLYRRYSRLSPYILLVLVSGGSIAGAAWYGWGAASIFAGPDAVARWMGPRSRRRIPSVMMKLWVLSTIGPGLVITRWLSSLGAVILLPFSVLYGAALVAQDDLPTWPPSPEWAMAMMPYVQLGYTFLYYDLFGPLERRLNRALRGRPQPTRQQPPREEAPAGAAQEQAAAGGAPRDEEADGILNTVLNFGRNVLGFFVDWPAGAPVGVEVEIAEEFEIRIGAGGGDDEPEDGARAADQAGDQGQPEADAEQDGYQILDGDAAAQPARQQPQQGQQNQQQQDQQPRNQNNQNQRRNNNNNNNINNNNNNNNNNNDAAPGEPSAFAAVINSIVTSLLLPAISYGAGELIRLAAPRAWVTRPWRRPATGLLQERWGRSLVGGCLFVVLKDALALYTKYRRVQVKANRRVRNVERRAAAAGR